MPRDRKSHDLVNGLRHQLLMEIDQRHLRVCRVQEVCVVAARKATKSHHNTVQDDIVSEKSLFNEPLYISVKEPSSVSFL